MIRITSHDSSSTAMESDLQGQTDFDKNALNREGSSGSLLATSSMSSRRELSSSTNFGSRRWEWNGAWDDERGFGIYFPNGRALAALLSQYLSPYLSVSLGLTLVRSIIVKWNRSHEVGKIPTPWSPNTSQLLDSSRKPSKAMVEGHAVYRADRMLGPFPWISWYHAGAQGHLALTLETIKRSTQESCKGALLLGAIDQNQVDTVFFLMKRLPELAQQGIQFIPKPNAMSLSMSPLLVALLSYSTSRGHIVSALLETGLVKSPDSTNLPLSFGWTNRSLTILESKKFMGKFTLMEKNISLQCCPITVRALMKHRFHLFYERDLIFGRLPRGTAPTTTALHVACCHPDANHPSVLSIVKEICEGISEHGTNPVLPDIPKNGSDTTEMKSRIVCGLDFCGRTALSHCAYFGHTHTARYLLEFQHHSVEHEITKQLVRTQNTVAMKIPRSACSQKILEILDDSGIETIDDSAKKN